MGGLVGSLDVYTLEKKRANLLIRGRLSVVKKIQILKKRLDKIEKVCYNMSIYKDNIVKRNVVL